MGRAFHESGAVTYGEFEVIEKIRDCVEETEGG